MPKLIAQPFECGLWASLLPGTRVPWYAPFIASKLANIGRVDTHAKLSWAQRLKRVFVVGIDTCPACGGAVWITACIEDPLVIGKILAHLDAKASVPEVPGGC